MTPTVPDNWWPQALQWLSGESDVSSDPIVLAEICRPAGPDSYRHLYSALGQPDVIDHLVAARGFNGHDVDANGPHPSAAIGGYEPRFWVFTDGVHVLEPLILSWEAGSHRVLVPDPGFLMTYGLLPRLTGSDHTVHWDDPSEPEPDQVVVRAVAPTMFDEIPDAWVRARQSLVQDYVSLRGLALVQVFFGEIATAADHEAEALLGGADRLEIDLPGRTMWVVRLPDNRVKYMCWGIRKLLTPGPLPITEGTWNYPELQWPGMPRPVTRSMARGAGLGDAPHSVYVRDTVLADFEGRPEYSINPELGAVSYGNQWGVSWCRRFGRDLIQIDLKKLYEGNRPTVVAHYHAHAVSPPNQGSGDDRNVASRARRIAYALASIGECVASLLNYLTRQTLTGSDICGLSSTDMDYFGWWTCGDVEPTTRHIPPGLNRDGFLSRCASLDTLVAGNLAESQLRRALLELGVDATEVKDLRSLRLLDRLVRLSHLARQSGLSLVTDFVELNLRIGERPPADTPVRRLQVVNELRQLSAHPASEKDKEVRRALQSIGIDPDSLVAGYEAALDGVYDVVGDALEEIADSLCDC